MQIPDEVLNKTRRILEKRKEREDVKKRVEEEKRKRTEEINALRKSRETELREYAEQIWQWIGDFINSKESVLIFSVQNPITLFTARFWQGAPIDSLCQWTSVGLQMVIDSPYYSPIGIIVYEEHCKSMTYQRMELLGASSLINHLHPDFLKQFAEALNNGTVWEKINQDLSMFAY